MTNHHETHYDYYHTVPDALIKQLSDFRETHRLQSVTIAKHNWTYYTAGRTDREALLLLHGGGADAEAMFRYIQTFSQHFHVIAPNIPPEIKTLDDVVTGLRALLSLENVNEAVIVGLSFGAMLAQMYIRKFQDTVIDLVITHSLIPSKHLAEATRTQKNLLMMYPESLLLWMSKRSYRVHIADSSTPANDDIRAFWQAYFEELYSHHIRKKHLVSRARLMAQYHSEYEFNSRDLLQWHGDMLIIESEEDNVISGGDRGSLKAMYSRAYVQTLYGYDHLAPFLAADEMISSISNFLLKEDKP